MLKDIDVHWVSQGAAYSKAFGRRSRGLLQVSSDMLKDIDVHWVILGHSERRHIIGESDSHIGDKIKQALSSNLKVIACIGETESQRDGGQVRYSYALVLVKHVSFLLIQGGARHAK